MPQRSEPCVFDPHQVQAVLVLVEVVVELHQDIVVETVEPYEKLQRESR
jgi:hypothetical protein